jgi:glycyl-tRNA synthetase
MASYRLLSTNRTLPFSIFQLGKGFRNEIAPRGELFRMREFNMAELFEFAENEHDTMFSEYRPRHKMIVCTSDSEIPMTLGTTERFEGCSERMLIHLRIMNDLVQEMGIDPRRMRFVQQSATDRAHYSNDTWDLMTLVRIGERETWIECAGIADRGSYDTRGHYHERNPDGSEIVHPSVVEQSFGIDRLLYSIVEHGIDERGIFLRPWIAPISFAIGPLVKKDPRLVEKAREIEQKIRHEIRRYNQEIVYLDKDSIGKRYRRADKQGILFFLTIDSETLENETFTIRDRESMKQRRVSFETFCIKGREIFN